MYCLEFQGINSFLIGIAKLLLKEGVQRLTRGEICIELPEPIAIKIKDPTARLITVKERKWNPILPYAESLWLASGWNDIDFIEKYCRRMPSFSDDGFYLRGGYGPRLRYYNDSQEDYRSSSSLIESHDNYRIIDQFKYITYCFEKDSYTRQAIINIGDPIKDCFDEDLSLKISKDIPCTRQLQFMRSAKNNKLNLTVYMRSNDFIWGATAVNIFNYMFMQEYFSSILNMEIGEFFYFANNFHYYEKRHQSLVEKLAGVTVSEDIGYTYTKSFYNLNDFDSKVKQLGILERRYRMENTQGIDFGDDFFNDWAKVLYKQKNRSAKLDFANPILEGIMNDLS